MTQPPSDAGSHVRSQGIPGRWRLAGAAGALVLMTLVALLVYQTGGTSTAYLNFILIPVLLGAALFGLWGGLAFGLLAGLILGPFMPLDTAGGIDQPTLNWLTRTGIYVVLGGFSGWLFDTLRRHSDRLLEQAYHNPVTGLPNRESLEQYVRQLMREADAPQAAATRVFVISLEMANYQDSISALGFAAERPLLRTIADRLQAVTEPAGARLFHVHDDHFALILPHRSRKDALTLTRSAIECLQTPFDVLDIPVYLGAHAGLSSFPFHEQDEPTRLLTKAWMAMHEASHSGRRYRSYNRHSDDHSLDTVELLGQLQSALDDGQLHLHYQPKVALANGRVQGLEALLRWEHPVRGRIAPGQFIPPAERTGLIHDLTDRVLDLALADIARLRAQGLDMPVSVNISARNFLDPAFADRLLEKVQASGLPPCAVELEFTETALMADPDEVIHALRRLTATGMELAIDDFGTGYSSLAYIKRMPVTTLKIDQAFVSQMLEHPVDAQITRASISLARDLGLKVVAEGAEDARTLDRLREYGCDAAQGFGIAHPMPLEAMLEWAQTRGTVPAPCAEHRQEANG
ncbi:MULTISPECIES: bifunctional diguanylate cyclase/phosphodiesterase [unclassified Thioalkalivibrio]|uniref:putative bifunctional diguanylate cyclase/phosphodiesterase n=1 Tax=unclassified Thioalkalivibrio TaxID=2621013 RepID=UPI0003A8D637|nr:MULTISPECIES: EAL domain-containing protein [unclassified Thioalkalivibrio]